MDTSRRARSVALGACAGLTLAGCVGTGAPTYVEPSRVGGHLLAVQSEPPATVNILPAPGGEIVLSEHGCFALRSRTGVPDLVIYAPYGSRITPDGQGFTYGSTTLHLGDQLSGFSGSFSSYAHVENPSPSLRECQPKRVVELW